LLGLRLVGSTCMA